MRTKRSFVARSVIVTAIITGVFLQAKGLPLLAQGTQKSSTPGTSGQSPHDSMPGMKHEVGTMKMDHMSGNDHAMAMPAEEGGIHFADKQWSEFNHRGAGWFLFFWGLTALIAGLLLPEKTWWRFAPGVVLLGLVEFLFIRNDPEAWPTGSIGLWASLNDPEVFQHRVFVLVLVAMAVVELMRPADRLPPFLSKYSLPLLAVIGGIYLFFHKHGGAEMQQMMVQMSGPTIPSNPAMRSMMASMEIIKHEHFWFSILGFGLAGAKLLGDTGWLKGRLGATLWTMFAIILGIYMMGYVE